MSELTKEQRQAQRRKAHAESVAAFHVARKAHEEKSSTAVTAKPARQTSLCIHYIDGKLIPPDQAPSVMKTWKRCEPTGKAVCSCRDCATGCGSYVTEEEAAKPLVDAAPPFPLLFNATVPRPASFAAHFDQSNLSPSTPGLRFNSSLIEFKGQLILAFRNGWKGSEIFLSHLSRDLEPIGPAVQLRLMHKDAGYGREDPRLFIHRGQLHVEFIGVIGGKQPRHTNVLYARLADDFRVEEIYSPVYAARNLWEKNWQFFSHDDELFAVYTANPHKVLRIDGNRAELVYETRCDVPWRGGEIRGGASPVRVGDEYWCFFHDRITMNRRQTYRLGVYTFEAAPPFRMRRIIADPLLVADVRTQPKDKNYADVAFACGAVLIGGDATGSRIGLSQEPNGYVSGLGLQSSGLGIGSTGNDSPTHGLQHFSGIVAPSWLISMGVHDRFTELHRFDHAALETRMVTVAVPPINSRDLILGAALVNGPDPFGSAHKTGKGQAELSKLGATDQWDYLRPFVQTAARWKADNLILHDGLSAAVQALGGKFLQLPRPDRYDNFASRLWMFRDYLTDHPEIRRAWLIDCNDVAFCTDPFEWLERYSPDALAVGIEPRTYGENPYYAEHLAPLPAIYRDTLIGKHGDELALNMGCIGGQREALIELLSSLCGHVALMRAHLDANPSKNPVMMEMMALGYVLLTHSWPLVRFRMDAESAVDGVPSPLVHERRDVGKFLILADLPTNPEIGDS